MLQNLAQCHVSSFILVFFCFVLYFTTLSTTQCIAANNETNDGTWNGKASEEVVMPKWFAILAFIYVGREMARETLDDVADSIRGSNLLYLEYNCREFHRHKPVCFDSFGHVYFGLKIICIKPSDPTILNLSIGKKR